MTQEYPENEKDEYGFPRESGRWSYQTYFNREKMLEDLDKADDVNTEMTEEVLE